MKRKDQKKVSVLAEIKLQYDRHQEIERRVSALTYKEK